MAGRPPCGWASAWAITPMSAANAIKVECNGSVAIGNGGLNGGAGVAVRVTNGSTQIGPNWSGFADGDGANEGTGSAMVYISGYDFPNSTSAQTYTPQVKTNNANTDITFPYGDTSGSPVIGLCVMKELMN